MAVRVAVVGTCAAGKTSVVAGLRERGVDAWAVAQEHSGIPELWRHLSPDRLVVLDVSLATLRRRRDDDGWPEWIYNIQLERLANARDHADIVVATDDLPLPEVVDAILTTLQTMSGT